MADHGKFHWNELMTNDVEAAKAFYAKVAGWTSEEMDMPEGGKYTVAMAGGEPAGGIMDMKQTQAPDGTPPHWFAYIAVDDVDARVAATKEAGGQVVMEPFDVEGVGRIAIIMDPTGAAVGIMTPAPQEG